MGNSSLVLFRAPELDGVLDPALCRAVATVPPGGLDCVPRPAVLILDSRRAEWLDAAAIDGELVCLLVVRLDEAVPDDSRVDDVVTAAATEAELLLRGARALARKRALARRTVPRAEADGVYWDDEFVALSATEARLAARLLAQPGSVISDLELARAAFGDAPWTRRALHAHIYRLRMKLRPLATLEIQAVRQRGFRAALASGVRRNEFEKLADDGETTRPPVTHVATEPLELGGRLLPRCCPPSWWCPRRKV